MIEEGGKDEKIEGRGGRKRSKQTRLIAEGSSGQTSFSLVDFVITSNSSSLLSSLSFVSPTQ